MAISRLVSGGQTGVDRAALDAALDVARETGDLEVGGWCPKGRRAEDGRLPEQYPLEETPSGAYAQRTEWNVRDADGTLIFTRGPLTGGTALTAELAEEYGRPRFVVDLEEEGTDEVSEERIVERVSARIVDWVAEAGIATLNVAGPRESGEPGIYEEVRPIVRAVLRRSLRS